MTQRGYIVKMSVGFDLKIDTDELPKAITIWKSGDVGRFKQGLIKGSLIAGIIEDKDREVIARDFDPETGKERQGRVRLLSDIFKDTNLDKKLLNQ